MFWRKVNSVKIREKFLSLRNVRKNFREFSELEKKIRNFFLLLFAEKDFERKFLNNILARKTIWNILLRHCLPQNKFRNNS